MLTILIITQSACGFIKTSDGLVNSDPNSSAPDDGATGGALSCRLYGKETAYQECVTNIDPREQTSLKALLRANDQAGSWSSLYFHTNQFKARYALSDEQIGCLESVLCDAIQSSIGN